MKNTLLRVPAALVVALALTSSAKTYYVDAATGDDANTGLKPGLAFATLQHAADTAAAGSTVLVVDGKEVVRPLTAEDVDTIGKACLFNSVNI